MKQPAITSKLIQIRNRIDAVDRQILFYIAKRQKLVRAIAREKKKIDLPMVNKIREHQVIADRQRNGGSLGISKSFIRRLFTMIIAESTRLEGKI